MWASLVGSPTGFSANPQADLQWKTSGEGTIVHSQYWHNKLQATEPQVTAGTAMVEVDMHMPSKMRSLSRGRPGFEDSKWTRGSSPNVMKLSQNGWWRTRATGHPDSSGTRNGEEGEQKSWKLEYLLKRDRRNLDRTEETRTIILKEQD